MKDVDLKTLMTRIFTHAGVVRSVELETSEKGDCIIKIAFLPWSQFPLEDITEQLAAGGQLMNEECLYLRVQNSETLVTATIRINVNEEDWRKSLAKQMGYIIAQELRVAVRDNE